jgi:dTDP-4-amino-4,6-dideoxygalactose transaminase
MKVPLVDLRAQHAALASELKDAFERVALSGQFVLGSEVERFELELAALVRARHAIGVSSGTDALLCGLLALGIGAGDEVITSPFTFFATVEAIARVGATPRFVDIRSDTLNIDARAVEAAITPRTRAIVPVHLFGIPADLFDLDKLLKDNGIFLFEDAAQALGAAHEGRPAGSFGDLAAFSFHPTKPLGALGDAGAVATNDDALAERCRQLRVHGASRKHHHTKLGGNFRMDALQAALLRVKLPHLERWLGLRRQNAQRYTEALADVEGLVVPGVPSHVRSSWAQYTLRVRGAPRDALAAHLAAAGIETAVHYPQSIYAQPALAHLRVEPEAFPEAERAAREVLSIPVCAELTVEQREHVIGSILAFFRRSKNSLT